MVAKALRVRITFDRRRFGSDCRAWRKRERMSLEQVARVVGASQSQLSRVELGETTARGDVLASLVVLASLDLADYCTTEGYECQR